MGQQLDRTDTQNSGGDATVRAVLFKAFEAADPIALKDAMNTWITGLPAAFPSFNFDIIDSSFYTYAQGSNFTHVAMVQVYFEGKPVGNVPSVSTLP